MTDAHVLPMTSYGVQATAYTATWAWLCTMLNSAFLIPASRLFKTREKRHEAPGSSPAQSTALFSKIFAESLNFAILTHVSNPSILPRHVAHTPLGTPSPGAAGARENADNSIVRTIFFLRFVFLLEPFPVLRGCLF